MRILWVGLLIGVLAAFAVSLAMTPAPEGFGTHQQLGLPPCSVRVWWGVPCPACGMTTSWSLFVRGWWGRSIVVNAGGWMLAGLATVVGCVAAGVVWSGRGPSRRMVWCGVVWAWGALGVAILQWAWRVEWDMGYG